MPKGRGQQDFGTVEGGSPRSSPYSVVLLGLPGAGKGTQGAQFARSHRIPKISTGDMLRGAVARGTGLGSEVADTLNRGGLVPDDLIIRVVEERLRHPDTAGGFLLDGFPRTVPQADALDALIAGRGPLLVVYLEVNPDVILQRILSRRICDSCGQADTGAPTSDYCASCGGSIAKRADDHVDVVRNRLAAFVENTQPLVDWYRKRPMFRAIDGDRPLAVVARAFDAAVLDCLSGNPGK